MVETEEDVSAEKQRKRAARDLAARLAEQLQETEAEPRERLLRLALVLGEERLEAFLARTLEVEAGGGMMVLDGSRRRTLGGVFFHLVRGGLSTKERIRAGFYPKAKKSPARATPAVDGQAVKEPEPDLGVVLHELLEHVGKAMTVKITLIGRPGKPNVREQMVLVAMRNKRVPTLPKGLPVPPGEPPVYGILMARKHWSKVETALRDPEDVLIVEGYPTLDPRFNGITVYATQATTKNLQAATRAEQQAKAATPAGE